MQLRAHGPETWRYMLSLETDIEVSADIQPGVPSIRIRTN